MNYRILSFAFFCACIGIFLSCYQTHDSLSVSLTSSSEDTTGPFLEQVAAQNRSEILVTFSEPISEESAGNFLNYTIPGLVVIFAIPGTENTDQVTLITANQDSVEYVLTVSDIIDLQGNALQKPSSMSFTGFNPPDTGCPDVQYIKAPHKNMIQLAFSELMDQTTISNKDNYYISGLSITDVMLSLNPYIVNLYTADQLPISYTVEFSGLTDLAGNELCAGTINTFTGSTEKDTSQPYISAIIPLHTNAIELYFSEAIVLEELTNPANYSIPDLTVTGAAPVDSQNQRVRIFTTDQTTQTYTCTVSGIHDYAGNIIGTPNSGTFQGSTNTPGDEPTILSIQAVSNTQVEIFYSTTMEPTSTTDVGNYSIAGLSISTIQLDPTNQAKAIVTTAAQSNTQYTIEVNQVKSAQNTVLSEVISVNFQGYLPLCLETVTPISPSLIEAEFNKELNTSIAVETGNYTINTNGNPPGTINVTAVQVATTNHKKVKIYTDTQQHYLYTLEVTGLEDTEGSGLDSATSCREGDFMGEDSDTTPPTLDNAVALSNNRLRVLFNEPVDTTSAENPANYDLSPSIPILSASRDGGDYSMVYLETCYLGTSGYTLTIIGVEDEHGNAILAPGESDTVTAPAFTITPDDTATCLDETTNLSWETASGFTYDVYLDTDSDVNTTGATLVESGCTGTTLSSPYTCSAEGIYWWKVLPKHATCSDIVFVAADSLEVHGTPEVEQAIITTDTTPEINAVWTVPSDCTVDSILVKRKSSGIPTGPTDGTTITNTTTSFNDTGVVADTLYYYKIFTFRSGVGYSDGVLVSGIAGKKSVNPTPIPDASITIDGFDDESVWSDAAEYTYSFTQMYNESLGLDPTMTGYVKLTYDSTNFYIFVHANDKYVHVDDLSGYPWEEDSFEFFFDMNFDQEDDCTPNPDDFQLNFTPDITESFTGKGNDTPWSYNSGWTPGVNIASSVSGTMNDEDDVDNYYTMEIAIPLSDLGVGSFSPGQTIGFSFSVNEDDTSDHGTQHPYAWSPGGIYCNSSTWGVCQFP
jgi:hypothetical protein